MSLLRLALVSTAILSFSTLAASAAGDENSRLLIKSNDRAQEKEWTPERMEKATPMGDLSVDPAKIKAAGDKLRAARKEGPPGSSPGATPDSSTRSAGDVKNYPLDMAGKLFFRTSKGDFVCSAQFIGWNILLTAAHCVQDSDTGEYFHDWIFALQYNKGKYSKLYRATDCVANKRAWSEPDDSKYQVDYAMITTDAKSKYGYFGTAWNWDGSYPEATKIGYPAGVNEGETMEVVNGPLSIEDGIVKMTHHGVPNQHGSSGGAGVAPWSTNVDEDEKNYVISLESHGRGEAGVTYGPYFDDRFQNLLEYVEDGCQ
jgi:V8-like Glu-specific endopeptidase